MVPTVTGKIYEAKEALRCSPHQNREDSLEHNLHHKDASVLGLGSVSGSLGAKVGPVLVSKALLQQSHTCSFVYSCNRENVVHKASSICQLALHKKSC